MSYRVYNFSAGPAILPQPVMEQAQNELIDYKGSGMSILEMSHRSKIFEEILLGAKALFKELLGIGDDYRVLFLQGGASTQFSMLPMNFLPEGAVADYILTGVWSEKALAEAAKLGKTHIAASTKEDRFRRIPSFEEISCSDDPAYIHLTSNNTIYGTQWRDFPSFGNRPLVADMSSDFLSHPFDASRFSLIYAGAQKNLGPSGVTIVVIKKEFAAKATEPAQTMFKYSTYMENVSLYNTPPCFPIYMVYLVLNWIKGLGGLSAIAEINQKKAAHIYRTIDESGGFYRGHAEKDSRSLMNITFNLENSELEKCFDQEAEASGLIGLKGHRLIGGLRASVYNAMPEAGCLALADFMKDFQRKNG